MRERVNEEEKEDVRRRRRGHPSSFSSSSSDLLISSLVLMCAPHPHFPRSPPSFLIQSGVNKRFRRQGGVKEELRSGGTMERVVSTENLGGPGRSMKTWRSSGGEQKSRGGERAK